MKMEIRRHAQNAEETKAASENDGNFFIFSSIIFNAANIF